MRYGKSPYWESPREQQAREYRERWQSPEECQPRSRDQVESNGQILAWRA